MIKKLLLAASILSGALMASQAFAAAYYQPGQPAAKLMMMDSSTTSTAMPNMTYQVMRAQPPFSGSEQAAWLGLMFVITVALIWVVLLLLIAFLWQHIKKGKAKTKK